MCVCGCRPVLYYSKITIILLGRFMKPGMGIMDQFVLQPHHFLLSHGGKPTRFVPVLAQNTYVYGCRLALYHLILNISSL